MTGICAKANSNESEKTTIGTNAKRSKLLQLLQSLRYILGTLLMVQAVYQITGKPMIIHEAVTLHTFLSDLQ